MKQREQKTSVVIAAAEGLEWHQLEPFVESLGLTGYSGDLLLFVAGTSTTTERRLRAAGAKIVPVRRARLRVANHVVAPYSMKATRVRARVEPLYARVIHAAARLTPDPDAVTARLCAPISIPHVSRYFRAYRFLQANPHYANVMLSDVRDVVFQANPIDWDLRNSIWFFLEDQQYTLGTQRHNASWLRSAFGESVLRDLATEKISCSGITIGTAPAVLTYLREMVRLLSQLPHQYAGIDQAVHNYVVHRILKKRHLIENGHGAVLTVGLMSEDDARHALRDGTYRPRVVHQHDRHPALARELLEDLRRG